ncbi:hypothetical protein VCHENC02_4725, partial [Vibrio harveyi]
MLCLSSVWHSIGAAQSHLGSICLLILSMGDLKKFQ